jgi:hypothetical protein
MPTAGMTHTTTDFGKTCQVATKKAPPAIKLKGPFAYLVMSLTDVAGLHPFD